jgi:hypothetical protein
VKPLQREESQDGSWEASMGYGSVSTTLRSILANEARARVRTGYGRTETRGKTGAKTRGTRTETGTKARSTRADM